MHRQAERGAHAPDLSVTALAQHEAQRAARLRASSSLRVALDDARQRRRGERLGAPVTLCDRRDHHARSELRHLRVGGARRGGDRVRLALVLARAQQAIDDPAVRGEQQQAWLAWGFR